MKKRVVVPMSVFLYCFMLPLLLLYIGINVWTLFHHTGRLRSQHLTWALEPNGPRIISSPPSEFLVVIPGLGVSSLIPTLVSSLTSLSTSLEASGVDFSCLVLVTRKSLLQEASASISQCTVKEGIRTHSIQPVLHDTPFSPLSHLRPSQVASLVDEFFEQISRGRPSHIAVLMSHVDVSTVNASAFLTTMTASRYAVASAPITTNTQIGMRKECRSHRTFSTHVLFTVFGWEAWKCLHQVKNEKDTSFERNWIVAPNDHCNVKVGIIDDVRAFFHDKECEAGKGSCDAYYRSEATGLNQPWEEKVAAIKSKMFPYCETYRVGVQGNACTRAEAKMHSFDELPDAQSKSASSIGFVLGDGGYLFMSTHRAGWRAVIRYLWKTSKVLENMDSDLREIAWNRRICEWDGKESSMEEYFATDAKTREIVDSTRRELCWQRLLDDDAFDRTTGKRRKFLLVDVTEGWFLWRKRGVIDVPWIGIVHALHNLPSHLANDNLSKLFADLDFQTSLSHCVGIVVLASDQVKPTMKEIAKSDTHTSREFKVCSVLHPIAVEETAKPYDPHVDLDATFKEGHGVVLLGKQYRRVSTLHRLKLHGRPKFWLPGGELEDPYQMTMVELEVDGVEWDPSVTVVQYKGNEEYDQMVKQNIVVIDLWAATANNAVLEIIALNTPAFVRKLNSTAEYLGEEYPLLFSSFDGLQSMLAANEDDLRRMLLKGHQYLKQMDKNRLSLVEFSRNLQRCATPRAR